MNGQIIGDEMMIIDDAGKGMFLPVVDESAVVWPCQINHDLLAAYAPHLLSEDDEPDQAVND